MYFKGYNILKGYNRHGDVHDNVTRILRRAFMTGILWLLQLVGRRKGETTIYTLKVGTKFKKQRHSDKVTIVELKVEAYARRIVVADECLSEAPWLQKTYYF